ncbi:MAG: hypothetical protein AB4042_06985 [Leptolyngbyaceae cyanobacterium]
MNSLLNYRDLTYQLGTTARKTRAIAGYPVNKKLIQFCGLQRSGNHGVINWIIAQEKSRICHINGVFPEANPWNKNWGISYHDFEYWPGKRDEVGAFVAKNMLICSYENRALTDIFSSSHPELKYYVGRSLSKYTILVLRDPYNTFASWFKSGWEVTPLILELWKDYAKEFLGITHYLPEKKVLVNFNRWFQEQDYRQQISTQLGLQFSDVGLAKVSHHGGGSSFDKQSFQGNTREMKLLGRFQAFAQDKHFIELFKDQEICDLSEQIFGQIPGVDVLEMS